MVLQRAFNFLLPIRAEEAGHYLAHPEEVLSELEAFTNLEQQDQRLSGSLSAEFGLFGRLVFPFSSRLGLSAGGTSARLISEPLSGERWAELAGEAQAVQEGLAYTIQLAVHAELPLGEKWGGRALGRMAEAAFSRGLEHALEKVHSRYPPRDPGSLC